MTRKRTSSIKDVTLLLHDRIRSQCLPIYNSGHFKHAALEAMTIVERVLKEKSGLNIKSAVALSEAVFEGTKGLQFYVPFGDEFQREASRLFQAAFAYYRNYAAHDGSKIDEKQCLRILILASELLILIGASEARHEPLRRLIDKGVFPDEKEALRLLELLDGYSVAEEAYDGIFELLALNGFTGEQMERLIDIGLIVFGKKEIDIPPELEMNWQPDIYESFELTIVGRAILKGIDPE